MKNIWADKRSWDDGMTAFFGVHLVLVIVSLTLGTIIGVLGIRALRGSGGAVTANTAEDRATGEPQVHRPRVSPVLRRISVMAQLFSADLDGIEDPTTISIGSPAWVTTAHRHGSDGSATPTPATAVAPFAASSCVHRMPARSVVA